MATSSWQNISYSIEFIRQINPTSILDVGCGFGRWGYLCREFLDVWNKRAYPESWQINIEGIEIYPKNITAAHNYVYNKIHIGDAKNVIDTLGSYDLIIFGDVLEHFAKQDGELLLQKAISRAKKGVLIHIPLGPNWEQAARDGNPFEIHLASWTVKDLRRYNSKIKIFRDYIGRRYAVAYILNKGIHMPTTIGVWFLKWRLARMHDLQLLFYWVKSNTGTKGLL
jgi:SAM-dependent methyltransferase